LNKQSQARDRDLAFINSVLVIHVEVVV